MAKRTKRPVGDCTIPPAIPDTALPSLLFKRDMDAETLVRRYVEREGKEEVTHAERVTTEYALGRKLEAWDVRTTKGRWWVITSPTNLYSQELFPSLDYTISFHVGVTARMMSQSRPDVEPMEEALLVAAWRKWQQAGEALDEAEEAENFPVGRDAVPREPDRNGEDPCQGGDGGARRGRAEARRRAGMVGADRRPHRVWQQR